MKILVIQESYVQGGADRSLIDLIRDWPIISDYFVVAINGGHPHPGFLSEVPVLRSAYLSWRDRTRQARDQNSRGWIQPLVHFVRTFVELEQLIRRERPGALILNNGGFPGGSSLYLALVSAACLRVPRRIMIIRNYPGPTVSRWRIVLATVILVAFRPRIVSVSHSLAAFLVQQARLPSSQVRTIHDGVESPKRERQLGSSPCSISIIGTVEERKGHEILIRALALLSEKHPALSLLIIGHCDESERQRLVAVAEQLHVERQLRWCPHVSDIDAAFAQVDILAVPSIRQESFGRVAVEAIARGIPVVASNCGGLPEVIEDGVSGIIVPRGDPESLASALDRVLCDLSVRQRFAKEGMQRFRTLFSASRMACEYAQLLQGD